ncbi:MAG: hypothetical protein ACREJU_11385 [Nitrospiraceae bacterium]
MALRLSLIVLLVAAYLGCAGPQDMPRHPANSLSTTPRVVSDIRAFVVGRHTSAVKQVIHDLQQIGFSVMKEKPAQPLVNTQLLGQEALHDAHANVSHADYFSEADLLVLVEVGGLSAYPRVAVKGIDIETGELVWQGDAAHLKGVGDGEYDRVVMGLTRRALLNGLNAP